MKKIVTDGLKLSYMIEKLSASMAPNFSAFASLRAKSVVIRIERGYNRLVQKRVPVEFGEFFDNFCSFG